MVIPGLAIGSVLLAALGAPVGSVFVMLIAALALVAIVEHHHPNEPLALANQITLGRGVTVCVLAGALAAPGLFVAAAWPLMLLALLALILDGVDGWVARRLGQCSDFGARFDMEVDAALIMVLCLALWLSGQAAAWVLLIGAMRYAFAASASFLPWLGRPLPERFRRKLVCVVQVVALLLAISPVLGPGLQAAMLAAALLALLASFGADIIWLYRHRPALPFTSSDQTRRSP